MRVCVVGAGGAGRETLDVALALDLAVVAFVDERRAGERVRGLPVVGLADVQADAFVIGIADPDARRRLADALTGRGLEAVTLVHPRAVVGPDTAIGRGSVVMALAHVSSDVALGEHTQVQYCSSIGHDSVGEDVVTVLPGARVSGGVRLGAGATVGSGAVVLQGRSVGPRAFVGAGAVVTRDVEPGMVVAGVPARVMGPVT